ncbi:hypothetical protein QYF36_007790 [Acer negundo]|nr:hypothetical protein QYF36_007790 [Acer negundo]
MIRHPCLSLVLGYPIFHRQKFSYVESFVKDIDIVAEFEDLIYNEVIEDDSTKDAKKTIVQRIVKGIAVQAPSKTEPVPFTCLRHSRYFHHFSDELFIYMIRYPYLNLVLSYPTFHRQKYSYMKSFVKNMYVVAEFNDLIYIGKSSHMESFVKDINVAEFDDLIYTKIIRYPCLSLVLGYPTFHRQKSSHMELFVKDMDVVAEFDDLIYTEVREDDLTKDAKKTIARKIVKDDPVSLPELDLRLSDLSPAEVFSCEIF